MADAENIKDTNNEGNNTKNGTTLNVSSSNNNDNNTLSLTTKVASLFQKRTKTTKPTRTTTTTTTSYKKNKINTSKLIQSNNLGSKNKFNRKVQPIPSSSLQLDGHYHVETVDEALSCLHNISYYMPSSYIPSANEEDLFDKSNWQEQSKYTQQLLRELHGVSDFDAFTEQVLLQVAAVQEEEQYQFADFNQMPPLFSTPLRSPALLQQQEQQQEDPFLASKNGQENNDDNINNVINGVCNDDNFDDDGDNDDNDNDDFGDFQQATINHNDENNNDTTVILSTQQHEQQAIDSADDTQLDDKSNKPFPPVQGITDVHESADKQMQQNLSGSNDDDSNINSKDFHNATYPVSSQHNNNQLEEKKEHHPEILPSFMEFSSPTQLERPQRASITDDEDSSSNFVLQTPTQTKVPGQDNGRSNSQHLVIATSLSSSNHRDHYHFDNNVEDEDVSTMIDEDEACSIPSVVKFTSVSPAKRENCSPNLIIPSTVRWKPFTNDDIESEDDNNYDKSKSLVITAKKDGIPTALTFSRPKSPNTSRSTVCASPTMIPTTRQTEGDVDTPEGRFVRRHSQLLQEQQEDDILSHATNDAEWMQTIPQKYFGNPNLDDTVDVLDTIEWDWIPFWKIDTLLSPIGDNGDDNDKNKNDAYANNRYQDTIPLVQEQITSMLCDLDASQAFLQRQLHKTIQPHAETIKSVNQTIHECAQHLTVAQMYSERSNTSLRLAHGLSEGLELLNAWDQKQDYQWLQETFNRVFSIVNVEESIMNRIKDFTTRQTAAVQECKDILEMHGKLQTELEPYRVLTCLQDLSHRADAVPQVFLNRLHLLIESITVRCCYSSAPSSGSVTVPFPLDQEYPRLVESILLVLPKFQSNNNVDIATTWPQSIQLALIFEAHKSFCLAMLEEDVELEKQQSDVENTSQESGEEVDYDEEDDKDLWDILHQSWGNWEQLEYVRNKLVTGRFYKSEKPYSILPTIYHRLCMKLTDVLYAQYRLCCWHRENNNEDDSNILPNVQKELETCRQTTWMTCLKILEQFLGEFLRFDHQLSSSCVKRKLFNTSGSCEKWWAELKGFHNMYRWTHQFCSLGAEFVGSSPQSPFLEESFQSVHDKLYNVLKRHLRQFHVEAMNTMGSILSKEDWALHPLQNTQPTTTTGLSKAKEYTSIQQMLQDELVFTESESSATSWLSYCNHFEDGIFDYFAKFTTNGNPFSVKNGSFSSPENTLPANTTLASATSFFPAMKTLLKDYVGVDTTTTLLVPESVRIVVSVWLPRLVKIVELLPPLTDDATKVISNLFDLYSTTVFRICAGSAAYERVLLGIDPPRKKSTSLSDPSASPQAQRTSSPLFGWRQRQQPKVQRRTPSFCLTTLEAELAAPLPYELHHLKPVREYLVNAQKSLQGIVKLDLVDQWIVDPNPNPTQSRESFIDETSHILECRQAAGWSCMFLAAILDITNSKIRSSLLEEYTKSFCSAAVKMHSLAIRIGCLRAIRARTVIQAIITVGSGWEESKLHEHPNLYVESLCDWCATIWASMVRRNCFPLGAMTKTWMEIVQSGYLALLDGFSRIPYCSTEGRALMSMDLAAYAGGMSPGSVQERMVQDGQDLLLPPAITLLDRGMAYVDTYIKVYYYPKEDVLDWIRDNFRRYLMMHCIALIEIVSDNTNNNQSSKSQREIDLGIKQIQQLYLSTQDGTGLIDKYYNTD